MKARHAPERRPRGLRRTAAALMLAAAGGAAVAQETKPAPAPSPPPAAAPSDTKPASPVVGTPATVIDDKQIGSVLGQSVQSPKGDDMGRIVDVLIDRTGNVRAAVIDFGGFFGVGNRKIAVDWHSLHFKTDGKSDVIVADLPPDELRTAPVYKDGEPVVVLGGAGPAPAVPAPSPPTGPAAPAPAAK